MRTNKPDAANPAIASRFHSGHQWRGVADPERSARSTAGKFALGVVILGAGASSRMGQCKLLLPWGNTSVIGHLIRQWRALAVDQTAVVLAAGDAKLHSELDRLGFPRRDRIENPAPERGMFSSIRCAGTWNGWKADLTYWAIVLGDQPHLKLGTLRALLKFHRDHPDAICQPGFAGRARHPVLLPRRAFTELRHSRAGTLREFLHRTTVPAAVCPVDDPGLALDLDRPEDYQEALRLFAKTA